MPEDFYQMLGVDKRVSRRVLRRALRDRLEDVDIECGADLPAAERASELVQAYRVLSDPVARKRYDASITLLEEAVGVEEETTEESRSSLGSRAASLLPALAFILAGLASAALAITIADLLPH